MSAGPDLELPPKPAAPEPGDCCGGGCARCVFDMYEEDLERWQRQVAQVLGEREQMHAQDRRS